MSLYDIALRVTDEVCGPGTYVTLNQGHPDPGVQRAIKESQVNQPLLNNLSAQQALGGRPPQASAQPPRIILLLEDQKFCTHLMEIGVPDEIVLDIGRALSEKVPILNEIDRLRKENQNLLTANQNLNQRLTASETEVASLRRAAGSVKLVEEAVTE